MDQSHIIIPQRSNDKAVMGFSSLVRALYELESSAVARLVLKRQQRAARRTTHTINRARLRVPNTSHPPLRRGHPQLQVPTTRPHRHRLRQSPKRTPQPPQQRPTHSHGSLCRKHGP